MNRRLFLFAAPAVIVTPGLLMPVKRLAKLSLTVVTVDFTMPADTNSWSVETSQDGRTWQAAKVRDGVVEAPAGAHVRMGWIPWPTPSKLITAQLEVLGRAGAQRA